MSDLPPGIDAVGTGDSGAVPALPRCWPEVDTQSTAGDRRGGAWICLAWARGACRDGAACVNLHRLPSVVEEQRMAFSADGIDYDIFGRRRTSSVDAACLLFVTGLDEAASQREVRASLEKFSEWGALLRTWAGVAPGTGFVRFRSRACAQFASEAMDGRPIDPEGGPALRVTFSNSDPEQQRAIHSRQLALRAAEEAKRRRDAQHDLYERLEAEGRAAKAARPEANGGREGPAAAACGGGGGPEAAQPAVWEMTPGEVVTPVAEEYPGAEGPSGGEAPLTPQWQQQQQAAAATELPDGWVSGVDPATGAVYFHHAPSGRSQWERPEGARSQDRDAG